MLNIVIGNKAYSSWSLRGWLACRQSGLEFTETLVSLYDDAWVERRNGADVAPSDGKVPILWDGGTPVWDSLAIIAYLDGLTGGTRFWPAAPEARGLAWSMSAEMHAGFTALRHKHPMNIRRDAPLAPDDDVRADLHRITALWDQARTRFGGTGPFLFGDFGAADIMYAPVCSRIVTYSLPVPTPARTYVETVLDHPFLRAWFAAARTEDKVIERMERGVDA